MKYIYFPDVVLEFCITHEKLNSFTAGKNFIAYKICTLHIPHCKDKTFSPSCCVKYLITYFMLHLEM